MNPVAAVDFTDFIVSAFDQRAGTRWSLVGADAGKDSITTAVQ
jgi:hypothetical protein